MRLNGMTPEEWAKDAASVIDAGEDRHKVLTALVERIAMAAVQQYQGHAGLRKLVDEAKAQQRQSKRTFF